MSDIERASIPPPHLETDYLVIGAGAMGMAFADEVHTAKPDARITLVDRRARPGGHWNDAYPFVALHQPAAFYGMNSAKLGTGGADLASGPEIVAYYHRAMQRMLASGQVQFFSQSDCRVAEDGTAQIISLLDEHCVTQVEVTTRIADGGHMAVQVPSTHAPRYQVADDVNLIPLNELPKVRKPCQRYVVIGAGKTGMDAILFLLDRGVDPDKIRWIVSNDSWLWDRPSIQPGTASGEFLRLNQAIIDHRHVDKIFPALEQQGHIHRIDRDVMPTKWRCATVDPAEVEALRRVKDVVRLGRVQSICAQEMQLDEGSLPAEQGCLYVDCTANGLAKLPPRPVFDGKHITLQSLVMCQQVFSAAVIGRLTTTQMSDEKLNSLCRVVPHPEQKEDMPACIITSLRNVLDYTLHMPLWMRRSRLNFLHHESLFAFVTAALEARRKLPEAQAVVQAQQVNDAA